MMRKNMGLMAGIALLFAAGAWAQEPAGSPPNAAAAPSRQPPVAAPQFSVRDAIEQAYQLGFSTGQQVHGLSQQQIDDLLAKCGALCAPPKPEPPAAAPATLPHSEPAKPPTEKK